MTKHIPPLDPIGAMFPAARAITDPLGLLHEPEMPGIPEAPPPPPAPAPMPDPDNLLLKKKKQREAAATLQGGRQSTVLGGGETLGGGY